MNNVKEEFSDLAYIDVKSENPYDLFKEWYKEACLFSTAMPNALCLATVSKDMQVSARHLVLRRIEDDGFVIYTDNRSRKTRELEEVPTAAMCFLWAYLNDKGQRVARQHRIQNCSQSHRVLLREGHADRRQDPVREGRSVMPVDVQENRRLRNYNDMQTQITLFLCFFL
ncbi:pyridoxine/pyridoxamine 5'-phosphate oxidase isoform X3 [Nasonia vitripennis]|uniref:pyridoxal 5'-phosphate synthase n=1 Tax=Nasonia vitripennis TaxID=7425 RepID=A0A7M7QYV0_NASVI|nr:pyridoxine/pyridoxamine 5'-phosphate oxidase isoform X3 [Nasonia vitripennis]XP_032455684.1 pyridoxine/pyridoxamine 5'-phosphate oxidase isoform X3 [Nasonia vitripennis]